MPDIATRIAQARGDEPAERVLRGGRVFDVVTGALIDGDVAISGGVIVGIGASYDGKEVEDVTGLKNALSSKTTDLRTVKGDLAKAKADSETMLTQLKIVIRALGLCSAGTSAPWIARWLSHASIGAVKNERIVARSTSALRLLRNCASTSIDPAARMTRNTQYSRLARS